MTESSIPELLQSLPDRVDPDPDFAALLRAAVTTELETGHETPALELAQEVTVMTHSATSDARSPRVDPRLLAVAAVLLVAVVLAAVFAIQSGDEAGIADDVETDGATYAGGALDAFPVERPSPYRITATAGAVWTFELEGTLVKRDPETLEPLAQLTVPNSSIIAGGSDAVWVADAVDGNVLRVDAETAEVVATIPTGVAVVEDTFRAGRPGQAFSVEGTYARIGWVAVTDSAVWVSDLDGRLLRIDPATDEIVDEIDIAVEGHFIAADGKYVLLGDQVEERVQVIDTTSGEVVVDVDSLDHLVGADLHAGRAYIYDARRGGATSFSVPAVVTSVDLATGERAVSDTVGDVRLALPDSPLFSPSIVASGAGVLAPTDDELVVLDTVTLEVADRIAVGGRAGTLAVGADDTAWMTQVLDSVVQRLRPTDR